MQKTWVWPLSWGDPLERGMATHSRTSTWKILGTEDSGRLPSMELWRARHDLEIQFSSVQSLSVWLCDPMSRSTPGLPVHHQLLEFTQTHVHRVGDAIQPSHPLLSSSPPAPNSSQHQGLFQWVNSLHEVAKVLEFQLQLASRPAFLTMYSACKLNKQGDNIQPWHTPFPI